MFYLKYSPSFYYDFKLYYYRYYFLLLSLLLFSFFLSFFLDILSLPEEVFCVCEWYNLSYKITDKRKHILWCVRALKYYQLLIVSDWFREFHICVDLQDRISVHNDLLSIYQAVESCVSGEPKLDFALTKLSVRLKGTSEALGVLESYILHTYKEVLRTSVI